MSGVLQARVEEARKIEGRIVSGADEIVQPPLWTDVAKLIWPEKTDAELAAIAKRDPRTARRWLSGEFEPPNIIVTTIIKRIFEPRS